MRLALVATAIVAIQASQVEAASSETHSITIGLKILEGIRGAWLGFNRGLYKRANSSPMNAACMD